MEYTIILKNLREENKLTQKEIANILNCSQTAYSKYEQGIRELPLSALIKLSKYYKVSTDYILGLTNETEDKYKIKNQNNIFNNFGNINNN